MFIKYYDIGVFPHFYIEDFETDFTSEEEQYKLLEWGDKLSRCYLCDEQWPKLNMYESNYRNFNMYVAYGQCPLLQEGFTPF